MFLKHFICFFCWNHIITNQQWSYGPPWLRSSAWSWVSFSTSYLLACSWPEQQALHTKSSSPWLEPASATYCFFSAWFVPSCKTLCCCCGKLEAGKMPEASATAIFSEGQETCQSKWQWKIMEKQKNVSTVCKLSISSHSNLRLLHP